jgi:hypothetical protein
MALTPGPQDPVEGFLAVKERIADEYLRRPGINGIGVGFKEVGGRSTGGLAIRFYVTKKRTDLPPEEILPAFIEGLPTDVLEATFHRHIDRYQDEPRPVPLAPGGPDDDEGKYDPLVGGISIGVKAVGGAGTLGVMVKDSVGQDLMLSNYHVLIGSGNVGLGKDVCQPSADHSIVGWCSNCAKVEGGRLENVAYEDGEVGIDAAVALRTAREVKSSFVTDIGNILPPVDPLLGEEVKKRGQTSLLTTGVIVDIAASIRKGDDGIVLKNQVLVEADEGDFSSEGDSGALVVRVSDNACVSLLWGGTNSGLGVSCPIKPVLKTLNIKL